MLYSPLNNFTFILMKIANTRDKAGTPLSLSLSLKASFTHYTH